ncbi:uncharacterized protein BDR25DRAFT_343124 [Lindgomyces ingoldianus]|uniref:Uncharacterized protein n=1 Tax=Lindgomyces ingoldianus TaxID=673940 RepID=A0ACB6QVQ3_9PLEO|nr:uncharacterized protein BDR25DRAFT_343124 [Lindgomyces ingoldianus]KAF2470367.1 hypothetical protein BDR25DRAFT_343124 [Lindgomyces ingoldianus]
MSDLGLVSNCLSTKCLNELHNIESGRLSINTVTLSITIIVLSFFLEIVVHTSLDHRASATEPTDSENDVNDLDTPTPSNATLEDRASVTQLTSSEEAINTQDTLTPSNTPPDVRAKRLICAIFLITPICIAFGFRIQDTILHYPTACNCPNNPHIAPPNWWAITIFNILPFVCACSAFLRALTDCILARWNKSLRDEWWPEYAPIVAIAWMVLILPAVVGGIFWFVAMWFMGALETEIGQNAKVKVPQDEESQVLVNSMDEREREGEDDEETMYSLRSSAELTGCEGDLKMSNIL